MAQAGEPVGNEGPAPGGGASSVPGNPEKSEKDSTAKRDPGNSTEVTRVLGPEVVEALRAAAARKKLAAASGPAPIKPVTRGPAPARPAPGGAAVGNAAPGGAAVGNAAPGGAAVGNAAPGSAAVGNAAPGNATPSGTAPAQASAGPGGGSAKEAAPAVAAPTVVAAGRFAGARRLADRFWAYLRTGEKGKTATRRALLTAGGMASVLVLLVCTGLSGFFGSTAAPEIPIADIPTGPGTATGTASPTPATPQAATGPVRAAGDLDAVCGNIYYPTAPKYAAKGPHPVVISAKERLDLGNRSARTLNRYAYSGSAAAKKTWAPAAKQAQVVACLDLIGGGDKVKDCKTDVASSPKMPLKVGRYKLTVVEVATGRKLGETSLNGTGKACPWVVMTGSDPTLYTTVDDNQLYKALKAKVK